MPNRERWLHAITLLVAALALLSGATAAQEVLPSAACAMHTGVPHHYSINQESIYWSVVAVNPSGPDDKGIEVWTGPNATGTRLASGNGTDGTDFVVGDFNHTPLGNYYPSVIGGDPGAFYVIEWEDDANVLVPGVAEVGTAGGSSGDCGLARVWDVFLGAGRNYELRLDSSGPADVRLALFRNPGASAYWTDRSGSELEFAAGAQSIAAQIYAAPASDWYGVVVFNRSPDSPTATYAVNVAEGLPPGGCATQSGWPRGFYFDQEATRWAAVAVNPPPGDDKDIAVFTGPSGGGDLLAVSAGVEGTDFVIADFNHTPPGHYYAQVFFGASGDYVVAHATGSGFLVPDVPVSGDVGGGGAGCGLIQVWDAALEAGRDYRFTLTTQGAADIRVALFKNPGSGGYWDNRLGAEFEKPARETPFVYQAAADDVYGVVVMNSAEGSPAGSFTLEMSRAAPVALFDFVAEVEANDVTVRWRTGDENDALGFHVLRAPSPVVAEATAVTPELIPPGRHAYSYVDSALAPGRYWYWVEAVLTAGGSERYGPRAVEVSGSPLAFTAGVRPNPFSRSTTVRFTLTAPAPVHLDIYSIRGRALRSLIAGEIFGAGEHGREWDGRDEHGRLLPSGTYTYRLTAGGRSREGKVQLLR